MHSLEKDYGSVVHGENLYRPSFFKAWIEDLGLACFVFFSVH